MHLNQIEMIRQLSTLSIPSFYDHAPVGTALPFLTINTNQPLGFRADNGNYMKRWDFRIDLYTTEKSLELESQIEALLDSLELPWIQSEQYIDSQSCWEVEYEFQVLGLPDPSPAPTPAPDPEPAPEPEPEDDEDG